MLEYPFATDEQKELANMARSILEKELAPACTTWSRPTTERGSFPWTSSRPWPRRATPECWCPRNTAGWASIT